ncbi:MAG: DUF58 domain-containing protein [Planctomycetaceae bacterium]
MRQRRLYLYSFFRYLWTYKLTPVGRVLVLAIMVTALGSVTSQLPIYQLFCGLLALLAVAEVVGLIFKPRLRVDGEVPTRMVAGEPVSASILVSNQSTWRPALDVMLGLFGLPEGLRHADADLFVPVIQPGASVPMPLTIVAGRRGIYPLPGISVVSTFPFNLIRFGGARTSPSRVVVLPAYHALDELAVPVSQRYQPGGVMLAQGVGHSPEYIGNREYVPGEAARRIDSRAWARTGKPVVREYHEEYASRVALVLDTFLPASRFRRSVHEQRLEAAVSLMAAIATGLNIHEHVIDLFAAGPEMYVFKGLGATPHTDSVLEILAGIGACRHNPFDDITPLVTEQLATISTMICVFIDWDTVRARFLEQVLEAGCRVKGVLVVSTAGGESASIPSADELVIVQAEDVLSGAVRDL